MPTLREPLAKLGALAHMLSTLAHIIARVSSGTGERVNKEEIATAFSTTPLREALVRHRTDRFARTGDHPYRIFTNSDTCIASGAVRALVNAAGS